MIGAPGRRHLGTVMDELAVVEPHGPDRIVASDSRRRSGALVAIMGRARPTDAAALGVLVRDGGQLTVVACMPGGAPLSLRSRRIRRPLIVANGPDRPFTDSWNEAVVRWQPTRASIAVSVTRAGLTVATAFALTRVFAGRSWLLLMLLAAIAPPVCLEWTRRHRRAPRDPPRGGRRRRRVARGPRRRSVHDDPRDPVRARRWSSSAARLGRRAAHPPGRRGAGRAHRRGARARVRRRVRRRRAHVLDRDLARRAVRRVRAEHRAVHRDRRDRQRQLGRAHRAVRARRRSATSSRSRSTTSPSRRTWFHSRPAARVAARGRRRRSSARSRSSPR